jgi:hypothetical protein
MPLPVIIAAAIVLALVSLGGLLRLLGVRSRRGLAPPVSEAEARAHAMPLTKSVLSVSPSSRDRIRSDP